MRRLRLRDPRPCSPTDIDQATGLERMELLAKLQGEDPFFMEPLRVERMGTLKSPIMVKSLVSYSYSWQGRTFSDFRVESLALLLRLH